MGLSSISLDIMLPALPDIGLALAASSSNLAQLTVGAFLLGAAISSFVVGPVADRYGRRLPILCGLLVFVVASLVALFAKSMEMMLVLRFIQGAGVGTTRLSQAILRDRYSGSEMARAMSLVLTVFLIMPVLAPLVGQAILMVGDWRAIFFTMAVFGLVVLVWTWWRLPETLAPANRRPLARSGLGWLLLPQTGARSDMAWPLCCCSLPYTASSQLPNRSMVKLMDWEITSLLPWREQRSFSQLQPLSAHASFHGSARRL